MEKYIVEVKSREQLQTVIDYVGNKMVRNRFDDYKGDVLIYVRGDYVSYSSVKHYHDSQRSDIYKSMRYYTFLEFAEEKLGRKQPFETNEHEVDVINNPSHYNQFSREVIDTMKGMSTPEEFKGFLKLNAVKYISRYQGKNGAEDLGKAIWYIERLKEELTND